MALQCPQCGNPIEADFGVVTCSRCQSVLFVDIEGHLQLSESPDSSSEAPEGLLESSPVEMPPESNFQENWMQDQDLAASDALEPVFESTPPIAHFDLEPNSQDHALISETSEGAPAEVAMNSFESELESEPDVVDSEAETLFGGSPSSADLSEVSEYSNSDQATGPLAYSVTIEEIDTKEVRQQLAEALSDPKFQWDSKEILKKIKMGKLLLENLNPVKASVLVHRLQDIPVKVSWSQNVYS